ncbi:MAG: FtsX-like permease family protein [Firmicutes bacterium]|nr:FtsX-like permease family protein [Bacillota bacterium]
MGSWWKIMKVNNKTYMLHLAKKILNVNIKRKNILLVAIALTCILFTSLFSVVLGIGKSMELQTMKTIGTISHGSFKEVSDRDIEILSKDSDIKDYSVRTLVGNLNDEKTVAEVSTIDKKALNWSFMEDIKGDLPEKEDEVFIDIATAKKLGYKGEIGEKIQISFNIEKSHTGEVVDRKTKDFIISGTYREAIDSNTGVGQIYLSKAYTDQLDFPKKQNEMDVMLNNSWKIKDKLLKIAARNGYDIVDKPESLADNELRIGVNFAYLSNNDDFDVLTFLPAILFVLLALLAGFLIINNIFKISVNEDIKLFGLLKTIGMTKPQIKKLVHMESLLVAIPSLIVGNIVGVILGKIILNKIFSANIMLADISLSAISIFTIVLFSIIFTLITVFLSVITPARYASKISPIEASRYNEVEVKKEYKSRNISLWKLARRQVFSNKFRFISIVLSMSLAAVILNSVLTYTGNIDLEKGLSDSISTDYNIASPKYFRYMYLNSEDSLPKKYIKRIEKHEGFKHGGAIYSYGSEYTYPDIKIRDKKISPVLLGMDDYLISKQVFLEGKLDRDKWNLNDYVLIGEETDKNAPFKVGDKLIIDFKEKSKEVKVMGKINYNFSNGLRYYSVIHEDKDNESSPVLGQTCIYMAPKLYGELTGDKSIMSYGFDIEKSQKNSFNNLLKELEGNPDFAYDSRELQVDSFRDFKNLIEFVGYGLAVILFLISVLNFINIIATDIIKNRVNVSILEAIGMTKKDIKSYLVKKNLIYSISALLISVVIMVAVDKFILVDLMRSVKWTSFSFVIHPLIIVNMVNIIVGILFTLKFYEKHSRSSLVDRIRSLE